MGSSDNDSHPLFIKPRSALLRIHPKRLKITQWRTNAVNHKMFQRKSRCLKSPSGGGGLAALSSTTRFRTQSPAPAGVAPSAEAGSWWGEKQPFWISIKLQFNYQKPGKFLRLHSPTNCLIKDWDAKNTITLAG